MELTLSPMMERFAIEYVACSVATKAAEMAGYKSPMRQGSVLLKKPHVMDRIKELRKDAEVTHCAFDRRERNLEKLDNTIDDDDVQVRDRLKAIEIVNKMMGYNEPDKIDITTKVLEVDVSMQIRMAVRVLVENGYTVYPKKGRKVSR